MSQVPRTATQANEFIRRQHDQAEPVTNYDSKMVMLRAERHDTISLTDVVTRIKSGRDIPSKVTVVKRSNTYHGPKLVMKDVDSNYLLTAPGPETQLLLWHSNLLEDGEQHGWKKLAEVTATFADDQPQYDLCPECGEPMQTLEHERKAAVGRCPGPELDQ